VIVSWRCPLSAVWQVLSDAVALPASQAAFSVVAICS